MKLHFSGPMWRPLFTAWRVGSERNKARGLTEADNKHQAGTHRLLLSNTLVINAVRLQITSFVKHLFQQTLNYRYIRLFCDSPVLILLVVCHTTIPQNRFVFIQCLLPFKGSTEMFTVFSSNTQKDN